MSAVDRNRLRVCEYASGGISGKLLYTDSRSDTPPVDSLSESMWWDRAAARRQASATSNAVTLRVSRLSSTPMRWIGSARLRYLSA